MSLHCVPLLDCHSTEAMKVGYGLIIINGFMSVLNFYEAYKPHLDHFASCLILNAGDEISTFSSGFRALIQPPAWYLPNNP